MQSSPAQPHPRPQPLQGWEPVQPACGLQSPEPYTHEKCTHVQTHTQTYIDIHLWRDSPHDLVTQYTSPPLSSTLKKMCSWRYMEVLPEIHTDPEKYPQCHIETLPCLTESYNHTDYETYSGTCTNLDMYTDTAVFLGGPMCTWHLPSFDARLAKGHPWRAAAGYQTETWNQGGKGQNTCEHTRKHVCMHVTQSMHVLVTHGHVLVWKQAHAFHLCARVNVCAARWVHRCLSTCPCSVEL